MVLSDLAPSLWINENQPSLLPTSIRNTAVGAVLLPVSVRRLTARTCGCVTSTDRQLNDLVESCEVLPDATKAQKQEKQYQEITYKPQTQASTVHGIVTAARTRRG